MNGENNACRDHAPASPVECLPSRPDSGESAGFGFGPHTGPLGEDDNLSDYLLFQSVMENTEAYECVLSIILEEPELKLKEVQVEKVIPNERGKRSVKLDVMGIDLSGRRIGAEMQNDSEHDDLRKRIRFYQAMTDTPVLKSGKGTRYRDLPATCLIMITQEDLFEKDCAKYIFEERCQGIPELPLGDGTMKIFLNMKSKNGKPETVSLLQYMKDTRLENPEILVKDERILRLDRIVTEVKQSEEWEVRKMSIYSTAMERGTEVGKQLGIEIGRELGIEIGKELGKEFGKELGAAIGRENGLKALVKTLKKLLPDAEAVWMAITENDSYKDVSLDRIKQLY